MSSAAATTTSDYVTATLTIIIKLVVVFASLRSQAIDSTQSARRSIISGAETERIKWLNAKYDTFELQASSAFGFIFLFLFSAALLRTSLQLSARVRRLEREVFARKCKRAKSVVDDDDYDDIISIGLIDQIGRRTRLRAARRAARPLAADTFGGGGGGHTIRASERASVEPKT